MAVIPKDHKSLCKRKQRDIRDAEEHRHSGGHWVRGEAWLSPAQGAQPCEPGLHVLCKLLDPYLGSLCHPPAMCRSFRRGSQPCCLSQDLFQNLPRHLQCGTQPPCWGSAPSSCGEDTAWGDADDLKIPW